MNNRDGLDKTTTLPVAAQVDSAVDLGFVRTIPQAATVPKNWSVISGMVRLAETVTSRASVPASTTNAAVSRALTADYIADVELPSEEIGLHFQPKPIGKPYTTFLFKAFILNVALVVLLVVALINLGNPLVFAGVILVYVAYVAESVIFGPEAEIQEPSEQFSAKDAVATLKRFLRANGFIKIGIGFNIEVLEFERVLDNSTKIPKDMTEDTIFDVFDSKKPLLQLSLKYRYDLFSEREEKFINQRIKDFIETTQLEDNKNTRGLVDRTVLLVDGGTRSLPRVRTLVVNRGLENQSQLTKFFTNFYVHCVFIAIGLGWVHRQILDTFFIDKRVYTCSKVFVADFDASVEFVINSFGGGSMFSNLNIEDMADQARNMASREVNSVPEDPSNNEELEEVDVSNALPGTVSI